MSKTPMHTVAMHFLFCEHCTASQVFFDRHLREALLFPCTSCRNALPTPSVSGGKGPLMLRSEPRASENKLRE